MRMTRGNQVRAVYLYVLLLCIALGFLIAYRNNYKVDRSEGRVEELILLTHDECYHIHHWMWMLAAVAFIMFGRCIHNQYVVYGCMGLLIGMSLEDLLFKDWYKIRDNCHSEKVIRLLNRTRLH